MLTPYLIITNHSQWIQEPCPLVNRGQKFSLAKILGTIASESETQCQWRLEKLPRNWIIWGHLLRQHLLPRKVQKWKMGSIFFITKSRLRRSEIIFVSKVNYSTRIRRRKRNYTHTQKRNSGTLAFPSRSKRRQAEQLKMQLCSRDRCDFWSLVPIIPRQSTSNCHRRNIFQQSYA